VEPNSRLDSAVVFHVEQLRCGSTNQRTVFHVEQSVLVPSRGPSRYYHETCLKNT